MTNVWVDVCRFYANTVPFYLKDLITHVLVPAWGPGTNPYAS